MRLRTLPLSLAGVVTGIFIACGYICPSNVTILFIVLTTCCLQILSNLSNELGDILHGTDTEQRQGVHYSIMDGEMTVGEMKKLIVAVSAACCVSGLLMIYFSFGMLWAPEPLLFVLLGAAAIVAAMRYTLGNKPYGYRGLGDLFVFIFFGLVSTIGAFYICCHDFSGMLSAILPACAIGFFSIGVLNVNNIRDIKTDANTRVTVALKLGIKRARIYQTVLICLGWACLVLDSVMTASSIKGWLYFVTLPLFVLHLMGVWTREDRALDPMLPMLVMSTFALALIDGLFRII